MSMHSLVDRAFDGSNTCEVIVIDLTYMRGTGKPNYICTMVDLHNRQIIVYIYGAHRAAKLVMTALTSIAEPLKNIAS